MTRWRVEQMAGRWGTRTASWVAAPPGCPAGPHPARDCGCRRFWTRGAAEAYVAEREAEAA